MKNNLLCILFCFQTLINICQTNTIKGIVKDLKNNPLDLVTIIILESDSNKIVSYTISNSKGIFTLPIKKSLDSIILKVTHLGYKEQLKLIENTSSFHSFVLKENEEKLEEVIVKSLPISQKEDTVNYSVSRFKNEEDRVIADVLVRMPGIEVESTGRILYQGKPIQKYYIEGLDLLEGKYGIANNSIPIDEVSKIQILENHQPIRIIDTIVGSENASLNIKLKNKKVLVTPVKLGLGTKPLLYDASIVPILLSKNNQFIGSYKANNIGLDVIKELKVLTLEDFNEQKKILEFNWTEIISISPPIIDKKKWLNNAVQLTSFNYLKRLKNDYEIKIGSYYINDYQQQEETTKTRFFTGNRDITINEIKKNIFNISELANKITLEKNTKKKYFKNSFELNYKWNNELGLINNNEIIQNLDNPNTQVNNKLKLIFPFKKKLLELNSNIFYNTKNESLNIEPGFFNNLFNVENQLQSLNQNIENNFFYLDNNVGFTKLIKGISLKQIIGLSYKEHNLKSTIFLNDNDVSLQENFFLNDLLYKNLVSYMNTLLEYEIKKIKFRFTIPLNLINQDVTNKNDTPGRSLKRFTVNPELSVSRDLGDFWNVSTNTSYVNKFGNINEFTSGFIVNNYRNVSSYNSPIRIDNVNKFNFRIAYKNILKGLFVTGVYTNRKKKTNLIFDYSFSENGALSLQALEMSNNNFSNNFGIRTSKFFSKINTTININASTFSQKRPSLFNNELRLIKTNQNKLFVEVDYQYRNFLNFTLENNVLKSNAVSNDIQIQSLLKNQTIASLNIYPLENNIFNLTFENVIFHDSTNITNNYLNASYRYNFTKIKSSLELSYNNITNTKFFNNQFISEFTQTETNFVIRPSQLLVSFQFNF